MSDSEGLGPRDIQEWVDDALEAPMVILSFVFLALALIELTLPLAPAWGRVIALVQWIIWVIFALQFVILLAVARDKARFLRRNWLSALSVLLPFLRALRVFRAVRALRTLRVFRLFTITGRSVRQVGAVLEARGAGYVALATVLITFAAAAGVYLVEQNSPHRNILTYGDALWWAAAAITTVGSELAPKSAEGRVLAVVVYIFGMAVIGYITALLASYFVGKEFRPPSEEQQISAEIASAAGDEAHSTEELRRKVDRLIALLEERDRRQQGEGAG